MKDTVSCCFNTVTLDYFHSVAPTVIHVDKYEDRRMSEQPLTTLYLTFSHFSVIFLAVTNVINRLTATDKGSLLSSRVRAGLD